MERLGGGGHMNVAAAQRHADDIDAACKIVRDTVNQMKESGEI
jgi:c-di-AMP phosphodiesterase-like protein